MAETVSTPPAEPAPASEQLVRPLRGPQSSYRQRFRLVYVALGVILAGAVAGFVALVAQPGGEAGPIWSPWQPSQSDPQARAQEIADHVSAEYHLPSGSQLVGVQATPPTVQGIPIGAIAVRRPPSAGAESVDVFETNDTVVYILCGFGQACSITEGEPSVERQRLLRREALELALYTFRYLEDTDAVVAFLPPPPGQEAELALFFARGDLEPELDRPLRMTLPSQVPPLPDAMVANEVVTIDRLTISRLFRFQFQQAQDGTAVLILDDPSLPQPEQSQAGTQ